MAKTPEFNKVLEAIADIVAGKPVEDLEERLKAWKMETGPIRLIDLKNFVTWSKYENSILQGANPTDVYGTPDYRKWQDCAQGFLRDMLNKYS